MFASGESPPLLIALPLPVFPVIEQSQQGVVADCLLSPRRIEPMKRFMVPRNLEMVREDEGGGLVLQDLSSGARAPKGFQRIGGPSDLSL